MSRPRLLLVPFFTELEWEMLAPSLGEWAEVASFDPPGVGDEPAPEPLAAAIAAGDPSEVLRLFREAVAKRGLAEADKRGWDRFFIVSDSYGNQNAVRLAELGGDRGRGLALGHATLLRTGEGDRPTVVRDVYEAMGTMLRTDHEAFIAAAVAQLTQGAVDAELAQRWIARIADPTILTMLWEAFGRTTEPLRERIEALDLPLLLGEHVGCLMETKEGFEDCVAAFPESHTVACPEACLASSEFAEALREFCEAT